MQVRLLSWALKNPRIPRKAHVVKLVNTLHSGCSERTLLEVRVFSWARKTEIGYSPIFFCFTITLFVFCFPHTTIGCPSLSSEKQQQRQHFYLIPKSVVQGCPSLSSKSHDNKDNISFLFQKCCPKLSFVVVKKSHDNIDNKDNISISKKCCPRLSLVVVK